MVKLLLIALHLLLHNEDAESKVAKMKTLQEVQMLSVANVEEEVEEKNQRPEIKDVPLPKELLDYIWNQSIEYDFSYELILAIAKTESDFNYNETSQTNDYGMMQIHKPTAKWIAEELNLKKYNLKDPYTSIDFALFYLDSLRDAWDGRGLSQEDMFDMIIISYNRGVTGANRYAQKHGVENNTYLKKVLENKEWLEMNTITN